MIARMRTDSGLYFRRGGTGEPTLLLLHGLGATGEVWRGLEEVLRERWRGSWIVPDLPGHGRSAQDAPYSFGRMAAAIAEIDADSSHLVVLGHSLGGVLGLILGSGWFGEPFEAACGLGVKVRWSPEELVKAAELAAKPGRLFATREQAAQRWLKVAGLHDLWGADSPRIDAGLIEAEGGWHTALDQRAFAVGEPDMRGLLAASRAKILLTAGENDPMCPVEHLRALQPDATVLPGLGHNAHVEDPAALWPLLERMLATS
jgi:pimeloyl-ACP methyl ester carboxylesterase